MKLKGCSNGTSKFLSNIATQRPPGSGRWMGTGVSKTSRWVMMKTSATMAEEIGLLQRFLATSTDNIQFLEKRRLGRDLQF